MNDSANKKIFALNLQRLMQLKEVDRRRLCDDLKFKYSTVSEWLSGSKYPRIDKIEALADYFGVRNAADHLKKYEPAAEIFFKRSAFGLIGVKSAGFRLVGKRA